MKEEELEILIAENRKRISELDAQILEERKAMDNTIIKDWYFIAKGYTNGIKFIDSGKYRFISGYDYLNKTFKGTQRDFYNFLDELEDQVDSFKVIDCGEVK
jgi:hypothetical protein